MVSEQDYVCACAHDLEMASYATGSSYCVLKELGFGSVEGMRTLSVRGPTPEIRGQLESREWERDRNGNGNGKQDGNGILCKKLHGQKQLGTVGDCLHKQNQG